MKERFTVRIMEAPYAEDEVCIEELTAKELVQLIKLCCSHGLIVTVIEGA